MKLFVKLMLALVVLAVLLPFTLLKNNQGKTLMSFSDLRLPDFNLPGLPGMSASRELIPAQAGSGAMDTFYKWYDPTGNVQFTTEPPPAGVEYTVKQYDPNANVIQAVTLPVEETEIAASGSTAHANPASEKSAQAQTNPYDSKSIDKLFEDTRNVEQLLNQRINNQNEIIN